MIDVVIIGAGPIGLACGIEAQKLGLNYQIIDKGCLVNSLYNYPKNMTFFSTSDKLEIGNVPFISHLPKPTRSEALEYYRRVTDHWKLSLRLYEKVNSISKENDRFKIITDQQEIEAQYVVIASGFYDEINPMNVPGEDLPKVKHYYDEPHPYFRQNILVVGAANSAVDVALETFRKGANVTMLIRNNEFSSSVKYWVKPDIENRIKSGEITAHFNSKIVEITAGEVLIETPDGQQSIENDFVLAMTGYQPDFSFLESIGVKKGTDEYTTPNYSDDTQESNVENLYLAGVICGGKKTNKWFIENSRDHAVAIFKDIYQKTQS